MNRQNVTVNRSLVGAIAVVLLVASAVLTVLDTGGVQDLWAGACLKVGLVMGAFWLALPSLTRHSELGSASWGALAAAIGVALIVARTRVPMHIVLPALIAFVFLVRILGPRRTPKATSHPRRDF